MDSAYLVATLSTIVAVVAAVWYVGLRWSAGERLRRVRQQEEELIELLDLRDEEERPATGDAASAGSGELTVEITDSVGVTDSVEHTTDALLVHPSSKQVAEKVVEVATTTSGRSWWEKLGPYVAAFAAIIVALISFFKAPPPDCAAYASVLLEVNEAAASPQDAVGAVHSMSWDTLNEKCGSAEDFVSELNGLP